MGARVSIPAQYMRYSSDITTGSLKVTECRRIAELLLLGVGSDGWEEHIVTQNVLQARSPETARKLGRMLRRRLLSVDEPLWLLIRDGSATTATHGCMATAVKTSYLLGDFLDFVVREEYRAFSRCLSRRLWDDYLEACRSRDPEIKTLRESTRNRLRSSVFQMLAQAGYLTDTRSLKLQPLRIDPQVIAYLRSREENYVLRCLQVSP